MYRTMGRREWDAVQWRLSIGREQHAREAEVLIARAILKQEPGTSRDDALRRAALIQAESERAKWRAR